MSARHFLDLSTIEGADLRAILDSARRFKTGDDTKARHTLSGKLLAMVFERPSTRTRVSFEAGIKRLGGDAIVLSMAEMQVGRGETVEDTARVLSRYVDAIMVRTKSHETLTALAKAATVPVINGLTDRSHPCQIMADVMTFEEHRGPIQDQTVAWIGDGNNVVTSFIHAAERLQFRLNIACPEPLRPRADVLAWADERQARVRVTDDPYQAVDGARAVITDTWVSMGDEDRDTRLSLLRPYQVTTDLMRHAARDAIFLHCLPAHRGEEMTAEVMDGPASRVFDEAENRLWAQQAILAWCLR